MCTCILACDYGVVRSANESMTGFKLTPSSPAGFQKRDLLNLDSASTLTGLLPRLRALGSLVQFKECFFREEPVDRFLKACFE